MATAREADDHPIDAGAAICARVAFFVDGAVQPRHSEPITTSDLGDLFAEVAWQRTVADGRSAPAASGGFSCRWRQVGDSGVIDIALAADAGDPQATRTEFALDALAPVVQRGLQRLREQLDTDDEVDATCRLLAGDAAMVQVPARAVLPQAAPTWLSLDASPLHALASTAPRVPTTDGDRAVEVYFAEGARQRAEACARAGLSASAPVETGGLLLGHVARCTATGQALLLVEDVLPAAATQATKYSLEYSAATWQRIRAVVRTRQRRQSSLRIIGQVHGHNFSPEGERCKGCERRAICTSSTAFLSTSDLEWCRAVFPQSPWQLSQVFGFNARGEPDEAFYGQTRGCLRRRSYIRVPDDLFAGITGGTDQPGKPTP